MSKILAISFFIVGNNEIVVFAILKISSLVLCFVHDTVNIQGSKGGAVVRALASHQCGPGSTHGVDAICGLSLLLVLSLAPRGFSPGTPVSPSPQKPTFPNPNSTRNQVDEEPLCGCATCKSLFIFIYLFILFYTPTFQKRLTYFPWFWSESMFHNHIIMLTMYNTAIFFSLFAYQQQQQQLYLHDYNYVVTVLQKL